MTNQVRAARPGDVSAIVDAHIESFQGFFLTRLGPHFLRRLYSAYVGDRDCVSLVADDGESIAGFIVGPSRPKRFFRRLFWMQGPAFLWNALPALIKHPELVATRLLRAARYRGEPAIQYPHAMLVSSIAVRPDRMGTGIAGNLLEAFCREARDQGATHVYLTTDRDDNTVANYFYTRHKFVLNSCVTRSGDRVMNRYVRTLER